MVLSRTIILWLSVGIFVVMYSIIVYTKPALMFYDDGTIRDFGVGYKNKTVFPIWIVAVLLAAWCYLLVLFLGHMG
jgi:hypothetical protein